MGNGQSAPPPPKAVNKLSKPRTNSWGKLMGPKFRSRSRFNSEPNILRYSLGTEEVTVPEAAGQEDTEGIPSSSFRPKSLHGEILEVQVNGDVDGDYVESSDGLLVSNSQVVEVEVDKPNSPTRGALSAKRPSARPARLSLQNLQLSPNKRLSFVGETSSAQPSSAKLLRFTGIEEDDKRRQSGPLQRAQSDTNLYSPIRRRSFLQHGIATRTGGMDTDPLRWFRRSSNARGNAQNCNGSLASPTSNSLLNIPSTPRLEVDPSCPRAVTPSGSDYGHIGAFKLGSLRITNGAASPAPSDIPTTVCGDEEYISASEGRRSIQSDDEDMTEPGNDNSRDMAKDPWKESPHSRPHPETPNMEILQHGMQTVNAVSPKPISIETHLPLQEFSLFKFTDSPTRPRTPSNQFVPDDAMSPLSLENSPPMSPNFQVQATSKHMAVEDDLFEPEPQTQGKSTFRMHSSFDSACQDLETPVTVKINHPQDLELRLLSKSDSGYSSNMSLRSCTSNPTVVSNIQRLPAPSKARISTSDRRAYSCETATLNGKVTSPRERLSRSPSVEGTVSKASAVSYLTVRPKRLAPPSLQRSDTGRPSSRQPPPLSFKYSSPPMTRERVSRPPTRTSSEQTLRVESANSSSLTSTGIFAIPNTTPRWRPKPKARQPPQPVFTVKASPTLSEQLNIPPVPKDASRRLEQRTEGYPTMRFPNPWTEGASTSTGASSNESLDRIFSDGSMELGDELPSVPVNSPIQDGSSASSPVNERPSYGVSTSQGEISTESNDYPIRISPRDETPGFRTKKYSGLGIQGVSYHNRSHSDIRSERGRTTSRESPSLHSFERSAPRRYHSSEFRPRCPSCGPAPQTHEWYGQRSYSMVSQYPPPHISPAMNQNRTPRVSRARQKSLPPLPISMWTQDRIQASHMALHSMIPPVMTVPFPRPEERLFAQQAGSDSWRNRKSFWASRRSSESQQTPRSTRPSMEFHRPQPHALNHRMSYDMRPQEMNYEQETYDPRSQGVEWAQREKSYNNVFADLQWEQQNSYEEPHGTYYYSKENELPFFSQQEVDCGNNDEEPLYQQAPQAAHWRGTPTANVIEPDGFASDMANGYEVETWNMRPAQPKHKRRSFRDSYAWGVAMNAVPVFLQKVKITKS